MGNVRVACDERLRIVIPSEHAPAFEGSPEVVIGPAPNGRSLYLFPPPAWDGLVRRLREARAAGDPDAGPFVRLYTSLYRRERIQGSARRVSIHPELAALAGIQDAAVLVGSDDRLAVWSEPAWRERVSGVLADVLPLAEHSRWD